MVLHETILAMAHVLTFITTNQPQAAASSTGSRLLLHDACCPADGIASFTATRDISCTTLGESTTLCDLACIAISCLVNAMACSDGIPRIRQAASSQKNCMYCGLGTTASRPRPNAALVSCCPDILAACLQHTHANASRKPWEGLTLRTDSPHSSRVSSSQV